MTTASELKGKILSDIDDDLTGFGDEKYAEGDTAARTELGVQIKALQDQLAEIANEPDPVFPEVPYDLVYADLGREKVDIREYPDLQTACNETAREEKTLVHPFGLRIEAEADSIKVPDNLDFLWYGDIRKTTSTSDGAGGALFRNADLGRDLKNVRIRGNGTCGAVDDTKIGGIFDLYGEAVLAGINVDAWYGSRCYVLGGDIVASHLTYDGGLTAINNGGFRIIGGSVIAYWIRGRSGDDGLQMVPVGTKGAPHYDRPIKNSWVFDSSVVSNTKGIVTGLQARIEVDGKSTPDLRPVMGATIRDSGFVRCHVAGDKWGLAGQALSCKDPGDGRGAIDNITYSEVRVNQDLAPRRKSTAGEVQFNITPSAGSIKNLHGDITVRGVREGAKLYDANGFTWDFPDLRVVEA